jgi:hypothetical protein
MYLVFICAPGLRMVFGGEDQMDVSHYQGGKWGVGQHFAHRLVLPPGLHMLLVPLLQFQFRNYYPVTLRIWKCIFVVCSSYEREFRCGQFGLVLQEK